MTFSDYTITIRVDDSADWDTVARLVEAHAEQLVLSVEEECGEVVSDKLIWDPQHPFDPDCACDGPVGWHCPGEESQHWAERQTADSPCGHCGGSPEDLDA